MLSSLIFTVTTSNFQSTGEDGSLSVDYFTFSSSIAEYLKSASLVISHAGNHCFPYLKSSCCYLYLFGPVISSSRDICFFFLSIL